MGKEKEINTVLYTALDWLLGFFSKETVEKQYNAQYALYRTTKLYNAKESDAFYIALLRIISPYLDGTTRLVDVGCGLGRLTFECAKKSLRQCIGIDANIRLVYESIRIRNGNRKHIVRYKPDIRCEFRVGDGASLYLPDRSVDVVLLIHVLDRVNDPKLLISEAFRVLRRGGIVIIANPSDWYDTVTPKSSRFSEITQVLDNFAYKILTHKNLIFTVPVNARKSIRYLDEVHVVKKLLN